MKTYCDGCNVTHRPIMCFNKPRKPLRPRTQTKGYQNEKAAYIAWHALNPPDADGLWYCDYCGVPLTNDPERMKFGIRPLTIDHVKPRGSNAELRYDPKNFVACCYKCNSKKGSMDADTFKSKLIGS